jgi:hypothetical protein
VARHPEASGQGQDAAPSSVMAMVCSACAARLPAVAMAAGLSAETLRKIETGRLT